MPKRYWKHKPAPDKGNPEGSISDQELLNRVILAKALQVRASDQTVHLKTEAGDFEITPPVAFDILKASGKWPAEKLNKNQRGRKSRSKQ